MSKKCILFVGAFLTFFLIFSQGERLKGEEKSVEENLFLDGSFEKGEKKGAKGIVIPGRSGSVWWIGGSRQGKALSFGEEGDVEWEIERGKAYKGEACLKLTNKSRDILSTVDALPLYEIKGGESYTLRFAYRGEYLSYDKYDVGYRVMFTSDVQGKVDLPDKCLHDHSGKHRESEDWNVIEKEFVAPEEAVRGNLTFFCFEIGTWWLDDVSITKKVVNILKE